MNHRTEWLLLSVCSLFVITACHRSGVRSSDAVTGDEPIVDSNGDTLDSNPLDVLTDGDVSDSGPCPAEMVYVPTSHVCIDRYEASRGTGDAAQSVAGVMPWGSITWQDAKAACARSGKRLCVPEEWDDACRGPADLHYPYGNEYREGYCLIALIEGPYDPQPTGEYPLCEGGYPGLHDMVGNVEEWVDLYVYSEDAGERAGTRGGAALAHSVPYDCSQDYLYPPGIAYDYVGFRCCKSP